MLSVTQILYIKYLRAVSYFTDHLCEVVIDFMMAPTIEQLWDGAVLGEGPHWDIPTQSLYYVDILQKTIHKYTPSTKMHTQAILDKHPSFIIPLEGSRDRFVVGMDRDLSIVTWDGISNEPSKIEKFVEVDTDPDLQDNNFNDGKVDPTGRLWAGTMVKESDLGKYDIRKGTLYSFGPKKQVKSHFSNIHISNGLTWSIDHKKFYYIDTADERVDQFDFDIKNGIISNRKTIFTFSKHNLIGTPDGQTTDADGNLWVAVFRGSKIIKIDPRRPETLLETIDMPAKQVTSITFGGPNLDELYVTTACMTIMGEELAKPENGALYRITGLGVKGLPGVNAKL